MIYESIALICGVTAFLTARNEILSIVIIASGFGRGANGAAGPFSPVEQAWLAEEVASERRGWVYSLNSAFGFFGMGIGALLAMLPSVVDGQSKNGSQISAIQASAYRPLFLIVAAATIVNLILIFSAKEKYSGPRQKKIVDESAGERVIRRRENKSLAARYNG